MVSLNQILLFGGVAVAGYLVWTNQAAITSFVQGLVPGQTTPPATASGVSPASTSVNLGAGLAPGPSPVATGVNNSMLPNQIPSSISPVVSGGADVGGPNVDSGPTFSDPITGQTFNPATGQILSPGGSTSIPNFSPFVEPQTVPFPGSAGSSPCGAGTRFSSCYQQCMPAGILEPAPNDPRCIGLHTGNPPLGTTTSTSPNPCPDGSAPQADGSCPQHTPAPAPAPASTCPQGWVWNPATFQCVYPQGTPAGTLTPAPAPVAAAPPPVVTPAPTPTPVTVAPKPAPTPAPAQPSTNCSCCKNQHQGNCHSECNWHKNPGDMNTSRCKSCLACCGDYEGNACKSSSHVGYAYQGSRSNNHMTFASEGMLIAAAANRFPQRVARVSSRSQRVAPANPVAGHIFNRPYQYPNRVAVS